MLAPVLPWVPQTLGQGRGVSGQQGRSWNLGLQCQGICYRALCGAVFGDSKLYLFNLHVSKLMLRQPRSLPVLSRLHMPRLQFHLCQELGKYWGRCHTVIWTPEVQIPSRPLVPQLDKSHGQRTGLKVGMTLKMWGCVEP